MNLLISGRRRIKFLYRLGCFALNRGNLSVFLCLGVGTSGWAKNSQVTELHVKLLGQPCLLQGPLDGSILRTIHALGPAQIYPELSSTDPEESGIQIRRALEKIRNSKNIPSLLEGYRDKLTKRLEAQVAFFEGLDSLRKTHSTATLSKEGKHFLQTKEFKNFENLIKKIDINKGIAQQKNIIEQLFELYNDGIVQDPEKEFHRTIEKLKIQYICSFEETEEASEKTMEE